MDAYFGLCPNCGGGNDGYLNIGKGHWFVCNQCKTKWFFGSNLFSTWRYEDEDTWRQNHAKLADYQEVEPLSQARTLN
jgi:hypothetical protein